MVVVRFNDKSMQKDLKFLGQKIQSWTIANMIKLDVIQNYYNNEKEKFL